MVAAQIQRRKASRFVIARSEATWQSRSIRPDHRALPANTVTLRGMASRTPPSTRRVRSAGIPGNLQLPKALTERRYRRNRLVRFYRHLVRTGSAFQRLPRRFAPRNDKSGSRHGRRCHPITCQPARRSVSAATDAIGACRFNGGLYGLQVPSRDCTPRALPRASRSGRHVASLLAMTNRRRSPF